MKRPLVGFLVVTVSAWSFADHVDTGISVRGWDIDTSENLYAGRTHTSYPIVNMIDGWPETAWVFSGRKPGRQGVWQDRENYAVTVRPTSPTVLDGFRLMNGYNKNEPTFLKNNRIVEIKVYDSTQTWATDPANLVKTVVLSDRMGWHTVSLPRKTYEGLTLVFSGIRKGPDDDVCVSELQVLRHGTPIGFSGWKAYAATDGDECG